MRYRDRVLASALQNKTYSYPIWNHYIPTGKNYPYGTCSFNTGTNAPWLLVDSTALVYDELHQGPPYTTPGPFVSKLRYKCDPVLDPQHIAVQTTSTNILWTDCDTIAGRLPVSNWDSGFNTSAEVEPDLISTYGSKAYKTLLPVKPGASLAQFLAEIRDVPLMLKRSALTFRNLFMRDYRILAGQRYLAKRTAGEWLNYQFGYLPFISDLRRFYTVYKNLDNMLSQIMTNSGRWLKRKRAVVEDEDVTRTEDYEGGSTSTLLIRPLFTSNWYQHYVDSSVPSQHVMIDRITRNLVWASGKFRYYIPNVITPIWKAKAIAYLFGGIPSPLLLWELTPFSWLVDWIFALDSIYSNLDYDLVDCCSRDLCIMRTKETSYRMHGTTFFRNPTGPLHSEFNFRVVEKERRTGSLFGFGLSEDDFTLRQWSILGALGLTRIL